ncbi:MAG: hypothetical protein K2X34_04920 [Hyphomonadaceae bacterium]|nr:hypothetical protein [Hyphomonadaceae bacterium]
MPTELIGGALIAALVSAAACRLIIAAGPIDKPHAARHAHTNPTPTSGGLGIGLGFGVALMVLAFMTDIFQSEISPRGVVLLTIASLFSSVFLVVGFIDDAKPLSAKLKFVVFAALSIAAALIVEPVSAFPLGESTLVAPYWLALIGTAAWIFVMVNTVNFMDGANGLAMGSVAIGLTALGAISFVDGRLSAVALAMCSVGAILGFLVWNFPRGLLFAGDSGALFTGALAALVALIVIHRTGLSPVVPAIVFFPLLADALLTLVWRAYKRHSLLDGHSEHIYQILIRGGLSHAEVALSYWTAMATCAVIGFLVADRPLFAWIALGLLVFLSIVVSAVVRRFASRTNVGGV